MSSLQILVPGKEPKVYRLYKKLTSLGSDAECDIVLPDLFLSPVYARIQEDGGDFHIATVERRDEILVNGKRRKRHKLADRDRLQLGAIELVFSLQTPGAQVPEAAERTAISDVQAYRKVYEFSARLMER